MQEGPPLRPGEPAAEGDVAADAATVREALDGLRREIETRLAERATRVAPPIRDWTQLYDGLRRSLQRLGMSERSGEIDDFGMDEYALRRAGPLLDLLFDSYWRIDVGGDEALDFAEPELLVANRSGLLPWDGLMIAHGLARRHPRGERPRFMVADWLVTLPFAQSTLARLGGVRACRENAQRLLRTGRSVVAFPEGAKGATKVFRERYRVQRFGRGGVVRTAITNRVPLRPVAVVGGEEVHPILFKIETLAAQVGLPFVPITPTFPLLGPLGLLPLPSKWSIRLGEPIETAHLPRDAADDELLVWRMTEELRARVQRMLDADLHERPSIWG